MQHQIPKKQSLIGKKYYRMLVGGTANSVINALLIISDALVAGIFLGETSVAAVNLVAPIYNIGMFVSLIISLGTPILFSNAMGRFQKKEADRIFGLGLTAGLAGGVILVLLMTLLRDSYFAFFNLPPHILKPAMDYFFWVRFQILLSPLAEVMTEIVFADGDEALSTAATSAEGIGNLIFSILLCRFMGIAGIGLGSFIGIALRLSISSLHLFKKTSTLRPEFYFSFSLLLDVIRYSAIDSAGYLFLAIFSGVLNKYIVYRFGAEMLIMASVLIFVQEFALVFDGIGEAITPIISVYLAENCFPGVRKVWRLAVHTALAEGIGSTILLMLCSPVLPHLLGIEEPALVKTAMTGICLMAPAMTFICLLYLLSSYYLLLDRIWLGIWITAMRDVALVLPAAILLGQFFGIRGVFLGMTVGAVLACLLTSLILLGKYGKENFPLMLAAQERETPTFLFELTAEPEEIVKTRDLLEASLLSADVPQKDASRLMLLFEELFMAIHDNNPSQTVLAECTVRLSEEKATIITRDDGKNSTLADKNAQPDSLRLYILSGLLTSWSRAGAHLITMSFSRNLIEVDGDK